MGGMRGLMFTGDAPSRQADWAEKDARYRRREREDEGIEHLQHAQPGAVLRAHAERHRRAHGGGAARDGPGERLRLLALRGYRPSLNLVWGIEAALTGIHWADVSPETKARLKAELAAPWNARPFLVDDEDE